MQTIARQLAELYFHDGILESIQYTENTLTLIIESPEEALDRSQPPFLELTFTGVDILKWSPDGFSLQWNDRTLCGIHHLADRTDDDGLFIACAFDIWQPETGSQSPGFGLITFRADGFQWREFDPPPLTTVRTSAYH